MFRPLEEPESLADENTDIREIIYHYRMAGETLAWIAAKLNLSLNRTATYMRQYTVEMSKHVNLEDRQSVVQMELDRLDQLQASHWVPATEYHEVATLVGKGESAHVELVEAPPDINHAKFVLDLMRHRAKLQGLEQLNPTDQNVVHQVLVVGASQQAFLEALQAGQHPALPSGHRDNDVEGEAVEVEEFTT
jgi:hypothetical protein